MIRKRNSIVDSIRRCGLHPPPEEIPPDEQGKVDITSFRDTVMASLGNQASEAQLYQADNSWVHVGYHDECASMSSGSLSPDVGGKRGSMGEKPGLGQRR